MGCRLILLVGLITSASPDASGGEMQLEEPFVFVSNEYYTFGVADDFTAGIVLGDLDQDGDLDAFSVNGRHWAQQDYVFLNNGNGRFSIARRLDDELTTGYEPQAADFDEDGDLDLVVPGDRTENRYYENLGNGLFAPPRLFGPAGPARGLAVADIDRDGRLDVLVSQRSAVDYCVYGRPGGFSEPVYLDDETETVRVVLSDLDSDGWIDAAFADIGEGGAIIRLNDGAGGFRSPYRVAQSSAPMVDIAASDVNGDGSVDLVLAGIGENVIALNEDGAFDRKIAFGPADERSYGLAVADLDRDGHMDIVVANYGQPNSIYMNEDSGFRREVLPDDPEAHSYGVAIGDVNGDGLPDLVFANSGSLNRIHLQTRRDSADAILRR
jgi:hypothetical protein